ncbi:MAG: ACP S-malonyltransferase [Verrucomicrobiae bacterium]|nr:ACP S-malonyltransferase [Verrucomicrobiae bacterium]
MKPKVAFLFSGQGAQHVGMGADLIQLPASEKVYRDADRALGYSLSELCFAGPETKLTETRHCQPALYVHGLAGLAAFADKRPIEPDFVAGLSLGEFTAHAAAGTFSLEDGLRLVATRGAAMQEACDASPGGMLSLIGATPEKAQAIAAEVDVDIANLNCPGQVVLSGLLERLEKVPDAAKKEGIKRAIPLKVAGAYHSRLMEPARVTLEAALKDAPVQMPRCPVVANFSALPGATPDEIRDLLLRQVTGTVRWEESIRWLIAQGVRHFIEFGPGEVLAGLAKRIDADTRVASVSDVPSLEKALEFAAAEGLS